MALTESVEVRLGTHIPEFRLEDPFHQVVDSKSAFGQKGLMVVFTCNHCPYAQAVWPRIVQLARQFKPAGIETVAINPNIHPDYPEDSPMAMKQAVERWGITFPYIIDASQEIASAFHAVCTPDIFVYDSSRRLVYHGRVDDNWKEPELVKNHELQSALEAVAEGLDPLLVQHPSIGCSIKWRDE